MRGALWFFAVICSVVIEQTLTIQGYSLALSLLIVYFYALNSNEVGGTVFGGLAGLLADAAHAGLIGPSIAGYAAVGFLTPTVRNGFFTWTPLLGFFTLGALTALEASFAWVLTALFADNAPSISAAAAAIALRALFNAPVGLLLKVYNEPGA